MSTSKGLLSNLLIFAAGAAIGSVVTYIVMKRKQEVVEDIYEETEDTPATDSVEEEVKPYSETKSVDNGYEYGQDSVRYNKFVKKYAGNHLMDEIEKKEVKDVEKPYVIAPDEFEELEGYSSETLYYYTDGVLTDENDNVIDDADDIIGDDILEEFGENNYTSLYVRDDVRQTDYEILKDLSSYAEKYRMEE